MLRLGSVSIVFLIMFIAWPCGAGPSDADDAPQQTETENYKPFYKDRHRGWYAYEEETEQVEVEQPDEKPELPKYTYQELWDMPVAQFREYLKKLNEDVLDHPTLENGAQWNMAQDVTRRKATMFTSVVSLAGKINPQHSIYDVAPTTIPGIRAANEQRYSEIDSVLRSAKDEFGLIVFEQQGCGFCDQQRNILNYFITQYQWPIRFYDIHEHPKAVATFGIEQTPSIIIVSKESGKYIPISWGVIGKQDMQRQIFRSIRYLRGQIEPGQWNMYEFERNSGADPMKFVKREDVR